MTNMVQSNQLDEVDCLTKNIYHEARGESELGWKAVAWTTLNRTQSGKFPSNVCAVVYQPHQFSWTSRSINISNRELLNSIRQVAIDVMQAHRDGDVPAGLESMKHALYFDSMRPKRTKHVVTVGRHNFYEVRK